MQVHSAENIQSFSLRLPSPAIREEGSEIWLSWKAHYESDAVDKFYFRRLDCVGFLMTCH